MTDEPEDNALDDIGELLVRMSRDLKDVGFDVHLEQGDLLGVVLRSRMLVERELTEIIERPLPHPECLKRRWSFVHRLQLGAALGVIPKDHLQAYEYLDKMRDHAAHRLNYKFTVNEQEALTGRLPRDLRKAVEARDEPFPEPLRHALKLLVLTVALRRHGLQPPEQR